MNDELISYLEETHSRRLSALPTNLRPFTRETRNLPRCMVLTGPRGVGKTTFLIHHAQGRRFLYLSADNPYVAQESLYGIVRDVFLAGYKGVIIDEAHFARDWSLHAKALSDDFPDRSVWLSDSSSLVLRSGAGDLSRRYVPVVMPILSFREYLALRVGTDYPVFDPFGEIPVHADADLLRYHAEYRREGTRPFFAEGYYAERMREILHKTLHYDVPFFLPTVTDGNLRLMNAIVGTLAQASIPRLHVRSLCADWGIGAEKLYQLLFVMESVGVLRIVRRRNDTKARTAGDRLFFGDPTMYSVLKGDSGNARESLVVAAFAEAGHTVESTGDESAGDFVINGDVTIEVGGHRKARKAAQYVIRDGLDVPAGNAVPLWAVGFQY